MRLPERDIKRVCLNDRCKKTFGVANRFDDSKYCDYQCRDAQVSRVKYYAKKARNLKVISPPFITVA